MLPYLAHRNEYSILDSPSPSNLDPNDLPNDNNDGFGNISVTNEGTLK